MVEFGLEGELLSVVGAAGWRAMKEGIRSARMMMARGRTDNKYGSRQMKV